MAGANLRTLVAKLQPSNLARVQSVLRKHVGQQLLLQVIGLLAVLLGTVPPLVLTYFSYKTVSEEVSTLAVVQAGLLSRYASLNPDTWMYKTEHLESALRGLRANKHIEVQHRGETVLALGDRPTEMVLLRQADIIAFGKIDGVLQVRASVIYLRYMLLFGLLVSGGIAGLLFLLVKRFLLDPLRSEELTRALAENRLKDAFSDLEVQVNERTRALTGMLEQQTATTKILSVISSSPSDVQPVLDAIVQSVAGLFKECQATIIMLEGDWLQFRASAGLSAQFNIEKVRAIYPLPFDPDGNAASRMMQAELLPTDVLESGNAASRAINECRVFECLDTEAADSSVGRRALGAAGGFRAFVQVPLILANKGIGTINLTHPTPGFKLTGDQLEQMRSFAAQAVLAIEQVRLSNNTKVALERQTATAQILSIINSSPTDIQPAFEAIAGSVLRLCDAVHSSVALYDGSELRFVVLHKTSPAARAILDTKFPSAPQPGTSMGEAIFQRKVIHIPDVMADPAYPLKELAIADGYRAILVVPMLSQGLAVGLVVIGGRTPFSVDQIDMVKGFADQAVVSIENSRMFNETRDALDRQKATSAVLGVISASPTDVQPVFDAIVYC